MYLKQQGKSKTQKWKDGKAAGRYGTAGSSGSVQDPELREARDAVIAGHS